jgi:tRNA-dihydrouridine synthase B
MAGITDSPCRRIARRFGAGLLYTECVSAEGLRRRGATSLALCKFHEDERPIAVQLFGSEPEPIAEAAEVVTREFSPDLIDVNCGCPVKKFVTKGCGGALMQFPEKIGNIVSAICSRTDIPVSVKLRSGYFPTDETAVAAAQSAVAAGAALIAVHGRFVRKAKGTDADWNVIRRVREAIPDTPLIGNGDIFSLDDASRMVSETGCDRVMIARWAQGRPWIFAAMRKGIHHPDRLIVPELGVRVEIMLEQYRMMIPIYGERTAILRMRMQIGEYIHELPGAARLRRELMETIRFESICEILSRYVVAEKKGV